MGLKVYNLLGQEVRTLVNGEREAGSYTVRWDGKDGYGRDAPSGIYLCQLKTKDFLKVRKMLLLR